MPTSFDDIPSAFDAVRQFELQHYATLPAEVQQVLDRTAQVGASPVDRIVLTAEAVYAYRDAVPAAAKDVATGLIDIAQRHGWHGLNEDNRGRDITAVLAGKKLAKEPEPLASVRAPEPEETELPTEAPSE